MLVALNDSRVKDVVDAVDDSFNSSDGTQPKPRAVSRRVAIGAFASVGLGLVASAATLHAVLPGRERAKLAEGMDFDMQEGLLVDQDAPSSTGSDNNPDSMNSDADAAIDQSADIQATPTSNRLAVFDLHCDTLVGLVNLSYAPNDSSYSFAGFNRQTQLEPGEAISLYDNQLNVSLNRTSPFIWSQCFAIFIPDHFTGETALHFYRQIKRYLDRELSRHASHVGQARDGAQLKAAIDAQKTAAILTIEGGSFLTDSLAPIAEIAADGVKMLTLVWNNQNAIGSGVRASGGLTSFGYQVVSSLEDHHITIDVSHLNDEGFSNLLTVASRPFIATHSNSRAVCNHPRNLTDSQFLSIRDRGGIVGLNFYNGFLIVDKRAPTVEDVIRHLDHWLKLDGAKTIALGSDYDGASVPDWLKPCDKLAELHEHVSRAFDNQIADDLFFGNAARFFAENA